MDNLCSADGHVVSRDGHVLHFGWIHPPPAAIGDRDRVDSSYPRTNSRLVVCLPRQFPQILGGSI